MQIIGNLGLAGSGKTTLARILAERVLDEGYGVPVVMSFADPLKQAAGLFGAGKQENPVFYRTMCQHLGDWLRNRENVEGVTGPDFFVNHMADRIAEYNKKEEEEDTEYFLFIDDVRFENEVDFLKSIGSTILLCDARDRGVNPDSSDIYKHPSEAMAVSLFNADHEDRREVIDLMLDTSNLERTQGQINSSIGAVLIGRCLLVFEDDDDEEGEPDHEDE